MWHIDRFWQWLTWVCEQVGYPQIIIQWLIIMFHHFPLLKQQSLPFDHPILVCIMGHPPNYGSPGCSKADSKRGLVIPSWVAEEIPGLTSNIYPVVYPISIPYAPSLGPENMAQVFENGGPQLFESDTSLFRCEQIPFLDGEHKTMWTLMPNQYVCCLHFVYYCMMIIPICWWFRLHFWWWTISFDGENGEKPHQFRCWAIRRQDGVMYVVTELAQWIP